MNISLSLSSYICIALKWQISFGEIHAELIYDTFTAFPNWWCRPVGQLFSHSLCLAIALANEFPKWFRLSFKSNWNLWMRWHSAAETSQSALFQSFQMGMTFLIAPEEGRKERSQSSIGQWIKLWIHFENFYSRFSFRVFFFQI